MIQSIYGLFFYAQTLALQEYSEYSSFELKECVLILHDLYMSKRGTEYKVIRKKYGTQEVIFFFNDIPKTFFFIFYL
jgi:hypothetical protein